MTNEPIRHGVRGPFGMGRFGGIEVVKNSKKM